MIKKPLITIGRAEEIGFPELGIGTIPARVDSGAKTSAIWASHITEKDGRLEFSLFGSSSAFYSGDKISTQQYELRTVASSMGTVEERYVVKIIVSLHGRKIKASFTLANRSSQVYPVLVGRNILRGKFLVDVRRGQPLIRQEQMREVEKRAILSRTQKRQDIHS
jgi:hypothetical protein